MTKEFSSINLEIIISAYSCCPNRGSEPGMAWEWINHLAKFHKIHLITNCEFKDELINGLRDSNLDGQVIIHFNNIGEKATRMGHNQGDWRFYYYYKRWQKRTYHIAKEIIINNNIDLVHHLNMIGFREPGYLWKLDRPSVWGPIGGLNFIPISFLKEANGFIKIKLIVKGIITYIQINFSPRVQSAIKNNEIVIGAVENSKREILKFKKNNVHLLNETGCHFKEYDDESIANRFDNDNFNVLWVGKSQFRKQLDLALKIIENIKYIKNLKFHIVGVDMKDSDYHKYLEKIKVLGIEGIVHWHGKLPRSEVVNLMSKSQLFLFTSLDEGTPHVIIEAIENKLPIVCFDTCGQGECVNESIGVKIPVTNPKKALKDYTNTIIYLNQNRNVLNEFSQNCLNRSKELSWDSKVEKMNDYYDDAISAFSKLK
jgi:glycosyltransferase involved in cell wall biosynthesis